MTKNSKSSTWAFPRSILSIILALALVLGLAPSFGGASAYAAPSGESTQETLGGGVS